MVTAQLIDPATNTHLWSDTYPGDLSDLSTVFAMQADIAMNIANAVGAEFSLEEQANIEKIPTDSPEAYGYYLAALDSNRAVRLDFLDRAIEADPEFATAYAARAWRRATSLAFDTESQAAFESQVAEVERLARADIERALEIDPNLASAYLADGYIHERSWRGVQARDAYARAYELSPNDPDVLSNYAQFNGYIGDYEEAVRLAERRNELDPTGGRMALAEILWRTGDRERAVAIYRDELGRNPNSTLSNRHLAYYELSNGDSDRAKSHINVTELQAVNGNALFRIAAVANHYAQLGFQEDAERLLELFEEQAADRRVVTVARFSEHLARGNDDQALYWLERIVEEQQPYQGAVQIINIKWNIYDWPILEQPEFVAVRERLGYTDL
jgi:Tfp pilus assembly protein PilF